MLSSLHTGRVAARPMGGRLFCRVIWANLAPRPATSAVFCASWKACTTPGKSSRQSDSIVRNKTLMLWLLLHLRVPFIRPTTPGAPSGEQDRSHQRAKNRSRQFPSSRYCQACRSSCPSGPRPGCIREPSHGSPLKQLCYVASVRRSNDAQFGDDTSDVLGRRHVECGIEGADLATP